MTHRSLISTTYNLINSLKRTLEKLFVDWSVILIVIMNYFSSNEFIDIEVGQLAITN